MTALDLDESVLAERLRASRGERYFSPEAAALGDEVMKLILFGMERPLTKDDFMKGWRIAMKDDYVSAKFASFDKRQKGIFYDAMAKRAGQYQVRGVAPDAVRGYLKRWVEQAVLAAHIAKQMNKRKGRRIFE